MFSSSLFNFLQASPLQPSIMDDQETFLPISNTHVPIYTALPAGPHPDGFQARNRRRSIKAFLATFVGFLMVAFLVALIASYNGGHLRYNNINNNDDSISSASMEPTRLMGPVSRGSPAGVSEKSNRPFLLGSKALPAFPWSNDMLSWQTTLFHYQPEKNWMNDPNGPMFYKGWYHFFYQYNPHGAVWGDIAWGHAVSKDLILWFYLPLAMVPDQWYDINGVWSGSATILLDGQIVMLYTGSTNESVQVQNLAYPADPSDPLLINWVKYSGNPVLVPPQGIHFKDFRDPTTAWLTSEGKWRITVGSKVNKTGISLVYDTTDFKNFELLDSILHSVPGTGMWECVDFYPVSKKLQNGLDTSAYGPEIKHVMKASLDDTRNDHYAIGTYFEENGTWVPDIPDIDVGIGLRYDYGTFYASKTFYDQEKHRRVLWGWVTESDSEAADVKKGWASVTSIPRTLVLDKETGTNLLQWPVKEVESLRLNSKEFVNLKAGPGSVIPLDIGLATQLDIVAEFEVDKEALNRTAGTDVEFSCIASGGAAQRGALGPFGILVLADESLTEQTPVYFYVSRGSDGSFKTFFCTDKLRSSLANDVNKLVHGSFVPVLEGEKLSLRILVDHSIVESFGQGGRSAITARVYPTNAIYGAAKIFLFNNATEANVNASLRIWQMNSAFNRPYHNDSDIFQISPTASYNINNSLPLINLL